jgi:hypothetical protein
MMQLKEAIGRSKPEPRMDDFEGITRIIERAIMNTNERMIRFVFIGGFLAVLVLEAWVLVRAVELLF